MAFEGFDKVTHVIESICEVIKKKEDIKKMVLKIVIGLGVVATVTAGVYAIYKFVVKKDKKEGVLECVDDGKEEQPVIEAKEEAAEHAAEEVKEEAAKEQ